jgi:transposase InsO family protein
MWSWDITYLQSPVRGVFWYLYVIMDIWSRRIMGWAVHTTQSDALAATLFSTVCREHAVTTAGLVLNADNGGPKKGARRSRPSTRHTAGSRPSRRGKTLTITAARSSVSRPMICKPGVTTRSSSGELQYIRSSGQTTRNVVDVHPNSRTDVHPNPRSRH